MSVIPPVCESYDVVFLDQRNRSSVVASELEREQAVRVARREARSRGVGRMFLPGSEVVGAVVVIAPKPPRAHWREQAA